MRIFYIDDTLMILSYIILWPIFQIVIGFLCNKIPDSYFHKKSLLHKTYKFEKNGTFYKKYFRIHQWKKLIPDGAKAYKNGFQKKHLKTIEPDYIYAFIAETTRAELMHWLSIIPFFIFGFWSPAFVIWIMLAYALLVNIPPILAQRYNRPRLKKLYNTLQKRGSKIWRT